MLAATNTAYTSAPASRSSAAPAREWLPVVLTALMRTMRRLVITGEPTMASFKTTMLQVPPSLDAKGSTLRKRSQGSIVTPSFYLSRAAHEPFAAEHIPFRTRRTCTQPCSCVRQIPDRRRPSMEEWYTPWRAAANLVDVLHRIDRHPTSQIGQLTPRLWKTLFAANPPRSDLYLHYKGQLSRIHR